MLDPLDVGFVDWRDLIYSLSLEFIAEYKHLPITQVTPTLNELVEMHNLMQAADSDHDGKVTLE